MRMRRLVATAAQLVLLFAVATQAQSGKRPAHTLHAYRTTERITIDGLLNDAAWMKAPMEFEFTQRDPIEGVDPSERTQIQVAYDDTSIYFAVRLLTKNRRKSCASSPGATIIRTLIISSCNSAPTTIV